MGYRRDRDRGWGVGGCVAFRVFTQFIQLLCMLETQMNGHKVKVQCF